MQDDGEGTTFMQWRERAQSEVREDRPHLRPGLIALAVVVLLGVIVGLLLLFA